MKANHSIPWQSQPIESVVTDCTDGQTKILRSDYETTGAFPVIDQGKEFSNGFTSDESKLYRGKLPLVLFGDHTREIKFVDQPFALGADGVKALEPKPILAAKFLYYYLLKSPVEARGYSWHFKYLKEKASLSHPYPSKTALSRSSTKPTPSAKNAARPTRFPKESSPRCFMRCSGMSLAIQSHGLFRQSAIAWIAA